MRAARSGRCRNSTKKRTGPAGSTWCDASGATTPGCSGVERDVDAELGASVPQRARGHDDPGPDARCGHMPCAEAVRYRVLGELGRARERHARVRQLEPVAAHAVELLAKTAGAARGCDRPRSAHERRIVPHMLAMAAAEQGGPVARLVARKTGHGPSHGSGSIIPPGGTSAAGHREMARRVGAAARVHPDQHPVPPTVSRSPAPGRNQLVSGTGCHPVPGKSPRPFTHTVRNTSPSGSAFAREPLVGTDRARRGSFPNRRIFSATC